MMEPMLASEPTESTEASEPAEPIDRIEPADPMDRIDPLDPMDKMDPLEPMLRIEPAEPRLLLVRSPLRIRALSQVVAMKTFLVSVKASRASGPSSRPRPDCLKPPNGVE
jgi:hypothetical protein